MARLRIVPQDVGTTHVYVTNESGEEVEISSLVQEVTWHHRAGEIPTCTLKLLPMEEILDPTTGRSYSHPAKAFDDIIINGELVAVTVTVGSQQKSAEKWAVDVLAGTVSAPPR